MTDVQSGDTVRLHYTAKLPDGTEFESSAGREPLQFQVGAGQIIPGLDRKVEGLAVGEKTTVTVPAEEAYGARDESRVQALPRSAIPDEAEVGSLLQGRTPEGREVALTVVDLDEEKATVDANHPLAGKDLVFDVEVVEIVGS